MRRFVLVGAAALASPDFLLDDLAGTSGRLDVLLRAMRAALLVSHGVRRDAIAYLVLLGGPRAPRVVRVDGAAVQFLRPEERSLATLVKKVLAAPGGDGAFAPVKPGIALADGGIDVVLADARGATPYVLDEAGPDVRGAAIDPRGDAIFFVGGHLGFDAPTARAIVALGATPIAIGPVSVHAEDAVAVLGNELDRRAAC